MAHTIARKNILDLQPYRCARDDYSNGVLLDANENAFGPTSLPTKNLDPYDNSHTLERYPDPYQRQLKELYAAYRGHGMTPAHLFCGVGSDEAIDLLMRIFCQPAQDEILITPPTYGMYKVCAKVNDVGINAVPLTEDFDLRIPEVRGNEEYYCCTFVGRKLTFITTLCLLVLDRCLMPFRNVPSSFLFAVLEILPARRFPCRKLSRWLPRRVNTRDWSWSTRPM